MKKHLNAALQEDIGRQEHPPEEAFLLSADTQQTGSSFSVSRDEMNLAEFPITVLSTRANPKVKTLEFQDTVTQKNGKLIKREWIITGTDSDGLPTASDDEVLLGLLKLTVDDGLRNQKIYFTRYELLQILKWSTEGRSYTRLKNALDRLSGVRVKATNAFFDNETKSHSTKNFGIIDAYEFKDGRDKTLKESYFIWSEELFNSFQVGFIKKFDLDFYLDLKSSISKRLYRYLDKHHWYKTKHTFNLFTLAHEKIGISRNYKYASSIKQQLDPALEELIEKNFLSEVGYQGKGKRTEIVICAGRKKPRKKQSELEVIQETPASSSTATPVEGLIGELVSRGIDKRQAERILRELSKEELARVPAVIAYVDKQAAVADSKITKPAGFLYAAIKKGMDFVLPEDRKESLQTPQTDAPKSIYQSKKRRESIQASQRLEAQYMEARRKEIVELESTLEPEILARMKAEIEESVVNMKRTLGADTYQKVLQNKYEDQLAKFFRLPDFEEWLQSKTKQ